MQKRLQELPETRFLASNVPVGDLAYYDDRLGCVNAETIEVKGRGTSMFLPTSRVCQSYYGIVFWSHHSHKNEK